MARKPHALIGTRRRVHFNLRSRLWSVVSLNGPGRGLVIATVGDITLTGVRFYVSSSGRERTVRTGHRGVHAWCIGVVEQVNTTPDLTGLERITYNPHRAATFQLADGTPVHAADRLVLAKETPGALHGYAWTAPASR